MTTDIHDCRPAPAGNGHRANGQIDFVELGRALSDIGVAAAVFDPNDRLLVSNETFDNLHPVAPDLMRPGATFSDILRRVALSGALGEKIDDVDRWVEARLASREEQPNGIRGLRLSDDRHLLTLDCALADGSRLELCVDISEIQRMNGAFLAFSTIVASRQIEPEVKIARILALGCAQLGLPQAALLRSRDEDAIPVISHPPDGAGRLGIDLGSIPRVLHKPIILKGDASDRSAEAGGSSRRSNDEVGEQTLVAQIRVDEVHFGYVVFTGEVWRQTGCNETDLDVLAVFAEWIGHELARQQDLAELDEIHDKLAHQAKTDELTGLDNRRQFMSLATERFERARASGRPMCIAIIDVDHFKTINDDFGHDVGDRMLKLIAETARDHLAPEGMVARIGGEEFAICLDGLDLPEAVTVADELRRHIEEHCRLGIAHPHGCSARACAEGSMRRTIRSTVSIGVAPIGPDTSGVSDMLKQADGALYQAKRSGRNRVASA